MQRVKRRTFSGVVCEQEVYNVPDRIKSLEKAEPRPRFKNEEERELHRIGISRRKHARLINENYGPTSLYSTLTLDNESEVHTFGEPRAAEKGAQKVSTPFKECPSCGAHLDAGERCDCKETAAADRAQANTARITPPARAYYVGVDLADGKDYTATARGLVENG